jgi:hypothetical protein
LRVEQRLRQRREFRADFAGFVGEKLTQPVAEGATGAQPAAVQLAFRSAAAAPKRHTESRAVRADRDPVMLTQAGKHPVVTAARTTPTDTQRPIVAGATDVSVGPATGLELAPPAAAALGDVPAFVALVVGVGVAHSSGRIRAGRGRSLATFAGAGRSSVAVLRTPAFSAVGNEETLWLRPGEGGAHCAEPPPQRPARYASRSVRPLCALIIKP